MDNIQLKLLVIHVVSLEGTSILIESVKHEGCAATCGTEYLHDVYVGRA